MFMACAHHHKVTDKHHDDKEKYGIDMRTAAFVKAIERVAQGLKKTLS